MTLIEENNGEIQKRIERCRGIKAAAKKDSPLYSA
jgi:hypothetical protein